MVVIVLASLVGCASGHDTTIEQPASPVRDYGKLVQDLRSLAASSPSLSLVTLGTVRYGAFEAPVVLLRYQPPGSADSPRTPAGDVPGVLVTGGVHGNEPAGAGFCISLAESLASQDHDLPVSHVAPSAAARALRIDIIPVVNPWGWSHDIRYNGEGFDINRDFASYSTQEARLVRDVLTERTYELAIDHHEDPDAAGFYLYQYGLRGEDWCREVIAAAREQNLPIEQDVNMIILKTRDGLIDAPMWGLRYMKLTGQLSITNYLRLEGNPLVFTVETPTNLVMTERRSAHNLAFNLFVARLTELHTQGAD